MMKQGMLLVLATMCAAQNVRPLGEPVLLNAGEEFAEGLSEIKRDGLKYVVAWEGEESVNIQRFLKNGKKIGEPLSTEGRFNPQLAVLKRNKYVVVSQSFDADGLGVFGQIVNRGNVGPAIQLNNETNNGQEQAAVCTLSTKVGEGEKFVAVWASFADIGSGVLNIVGNVFNGEGEPLGQEFNITQGILAFLPRVVCLKKGGFVVSWIGISETSSVRLFNNEGQPLSEPTPIQGTEDAPVAVVSDLVQLNNGSIVALYVATDSLDFAEKSILQAQLLSTSGTPLNEPIVISDGPEDVQGAGRLAVLGDHSLVAVWDSFNTSDDGTDSLFAFGQTFTTTSTVGSRFQIGAGLNSSLGIVSARVATVRDFLFKEFVVSFTQVQDNTYGLAYIQRYRALI